MSQVILRDYQKEVYLEQIKKKVNIFLIEQHQILLKHLKGNLIKFINNRNKKVRFLKEIYSTHGNSDWCSLTNLRKLDKKF